MIIFTIIKNIYMKDGSIAIQLENSDNYQAALKKYRQYQKEVIQLMPDKVAIETNISDVTDEAPSKYEHATIYKDHPGPGQAAADIHIFARIMEPSLKEE